MPTAVKRIALAIGGGIVVTASFAAGHRVGFSVGRGAGIAEGRKSLAAVVRPYPSVEISEDSPGRVDICLQTSLVGNGHSFKGEIVQTIEGTVVRLGAARSVVPLRGHALLCEIDPEWYVDVVDARKTQWRLMYTVSGIPVEEPSLSIGSRVTIRLRAHWGFGKAAGVAVSDESGPLLIAEQGAFGHGLEPADVLPFTVTASDAIAVKHDGCGDAVMHAVEVQGDSAIRVMPGRIGMLTLRGRSYRFWNAASYNWINVNCTDMLDRMAWFLWRP
jgi:hypothetical protein